MVNNSELLDARLANLIGKNQLLQEQLNKIKQDVAEFVDFIETMPVMPVLLAESERLKDTMFFKALKKHVEEKDNVDK